LQHRRNPPAPGLWMMRRHFQSGSDRCSTQLR